MAAAMAESDNNGSEVSPGGGGGDSASAAAAVASPVKAKARALLELETASAAAAASESSEARVDDGNIQEAESSLREGLSLNYEVRSRNRIRIRNFESNRNPSLSRSSRSLFGFLVRSISERWNRVPPGWGARWWNGRIRIFRSMA